MLFNLFGSGLSPQEAVVYIGALVLAVLIAIVAHEVAHGVVAMWNGDMTAKYSGRLTPNPLAHLEPFGFLSLLIVGVGWAKPVPVNPTNFRHIRKGIFFTAIAGVVTNFIIAVITFTLWALLGGVLLNGVLAGSLFSKFFWWFLQSAVVINIALIAFNLLPIFPLDGFRIVESFTHYNNPYCKFMRSYGQYIFLGIIVLDIILGQFGISGPLSLYINFVRNSILDLFYWVRGLFV